MKINMSEVSANQLSVNVKTVNLDHECEMCRTGAELLQEIEGYLESFSEISLHQCEVCGLTFPSEKSLSAHQNVHTRNSDSPIEYLEKAMNLSNNSECVFCCRKFVRPHNLLKHYMTTHEGMMPQHIGIHVNNASVKSFKIIPKLKSSLEKKQNIKNPYSNTKKISDVPWIDKKKSETNSANLAANRSSCLTLSGQNGSIRLKISNNAKSITTISNITNEISLTSQETNLGEHASVDEKENQSVKFAIGKQGTTTSFKRQDIPSDMSPTVVKRVKIDGELLPQKQTEDIKNKPSDLIALSYVNNSENVLNSCVPSNSLQNITQPKISAIFKKSSAINNFKNLMIVPISKNALDIANVTTKSSIKPYEQKIGCTLKNITVHPIASSEIKANTSVMNKNADMKSGYGNTVIHKIVPFPINLQAGNKNTQINGGCAMNLPASRAKTYSKIHDDKTYPNKVNKDKMNSKDELQTPGISPSLDTAQMNIPLINTSTSTVPSNIIIKKIIDGGMASTDKSMVRLQPYGCSVDVGTRDQTEIMSKNMMFVGSMKGTAGNTVFWIPKNIRNPFVTKMNTTNPSKNGSNTVKQVLSCDSSQGNQQPTKNIQHSSSSQEDQSSTISSSSDI